MFVTGIQMTANPDNVEFHLGDTKLTWTYKELGVPGCDIILCLLKMSVDERITAIKREERKITRIIRQIANDGEATEPL